MVRLTPAGQAAFTELDTLQADAIDRLVGPLDEASDCNSSQRWAGSGGCSTTNTPPLD